MERDLGAQTWCIFDSGSLRTQLLNSDTAHSSSWAKYTFV